MDNNGPKLEVPAKSLKKAKEFLAGDPDNITEYCPSIGENLNKPLGVVFCPANQGRGITRNECNPESCPFSHRQYAVLKLPMNAEAQRIALEQYPWLDEVRVIKKENGDVERYEAIQLYCMRPKPVQETTVWQRDGDT